MIVYSVVTIVTCGKGAGMNYYNAPGQMDLSDRMAIEVGLTRKDSFRKIAQVLRRDPQTVEVQVGLEPKETDHNRQMVCEQQDLQ